MFSFFDNLKYRTEVFVEVYAILILVPELKSFLKTFPNLKNAIGEFKKSHMPPFDAAVYVSMILVEKLIEQVPSQTRSLVVQQLTEQREQGLLWFAQVGQAIMKGESDYPAGMPLLTIVLGNAMWYLDFAEREGRLSAQVHKTFVADVTSMLLGKTPEERRAIRAEVAINDIIFGDGHTED